MFRPSVAAGQRAFSQMMAARALAMSAGKAAGLQRPARPPQRPSIHVYRRAPAGYQFALPLYRPTRRSLASWFGSACIFGLKLLASGLAGVLVATALWHDQWKSASAPATVRNEIAAYSNPGETTVYRRAPAQGSADRGWETESMDAWDRAPPSNYPRRVRTMTFTPPKATGAIPPERARSAPVDSGSRVSSRNARSSRARSWSLPPSSGE
jgi:hypothetical protein